MDVDPKPRPRKARKPRVKLVTRLKRRVGDSYATVSGIVAEPRTAPSMARDGLIKLWRVRGGGFYGLGYVIAFVVLEIRMLIGNVVSGTDVVTMVVQEALEILFRFAVQSFINGFIAFGWPVFVVKYLGVWGLVAIGICWLLFDRLAKPWINARLPDLAPREAQENPAPEARAKRERRKLRKRRTRHAERPATESDGVP